MPGRITLKLRIGAGGALLPALLLCSATALAAIEGPVPLPPAESADGEAIEELEVIGQRTLLTFRMEMYRAEDRMYALFNELNGSDELDVDCEQRTLAGSHISVRSCNRRYMEEAQAESASAAFRGYAPPKSPVELWNENRPKHEQFSAEVQRLMDQNPAFTAAIADTVVSRERYTEARRDRVQNTFLGQLLTGNPD